MRLYPTASKRVYQIKHTVSCFRSHAVWCDGKTSALMSAHEQVMAGSSTESLTTCLPRCGLGDHLILLTKEWRIRSSYARHHWRQEDSQHMPFGWSCLISNSVLHGTHDSKRDTIQQANLGAPCRVELYSLPKREEGWLGRGGRDVRGGGEAGKGRV